MIYSLAAPKYFRINTYPLSFHLDLGTDPALPRLIEMGDCLKDLVLDDTVLPSRELKYLW